MTPEGAPRRARLLILVVHVAALLAGLAYAWGQWADVSAQQVAVDQTRQTVAQLDTRLGKSGGLRAAATQPIRDPFVLGDSAALAGANLQDRVVSAIRAAGGRVTSSQVDTSVAGPADSTASTPPAIQLTVSCQIGNSALQGLLYALETDAPALFLDQLTVDSGVRGGDNLSAGSDVLKISIVISAYWTGSEKF